MTRFRYSYSVILVAVLGSSGWSQNIDLAPVTSKQLSRTIDLPGEFLPFLSVSLHAKVQGYVERVLVDRGSIVKQGDLLVELSAPELKAQMPKRSKVRAAESDRCRRRPSARRPRAPTND